MKIAQTRFANEADTAAIEFKLLAALVAIAAIPAMQGLGSRLNTVFAATGTAHEAAAAPVIAQ